MLNLLESTGAPLIVITPCLEVLERKEPDQLRPAHEVLLDAATAVSQIDTRTPHQVAEEARRHLYWQVFYRFDDLLPTEARLAILHALLVGAMNANHCCDDLALSFIVRHIGFVGAAALARNLGYRPIWLRYPGWDEGRERFQIVSETFVSSFEHSSGNQTVTYRDAD